MESVLSILVVDDDSALRDLIATMLQVTGTIHKAGSGNEAIAFMKETPVDLIFSDVMMPNGSGIDLLDWVQTLPGKKPSVVLVTGQSTLSLESALARGAYCVIGKPFRMKTLTDVVTQIKQRNCDGRS